MSDTTTGKNSSDGYFTKQRHAAAKKIQDAYRDSSNEYAYDRKLIDEQAEERKRSLRLARVREREMELHVLRCLPADKVEQWTHFRRHRASRKIQNAWRRGSSTEASNADLRESGFVVRQSRQAGPVGKERLRVISAVIHAEQKLAAGIDEELELEAEEGRYFVPAPPQEPGAIRLANLQHTIQSKTADKMEKHEREKEDECAKIMSNAAGLTPRRRARLRQKAGAERGSAQQRYQKLLELRYKAKSAAMERQEAKMSGHDDYHRRERALLLKRTDDLLEKLTNPTELENVWPSDGTHVKPGAHIRSDDLMDADEDPALKKYPIPKGARLEYARKRHETTLGAMQLNKPWWRVVREGREFDVRDLSRPQPWSQWKNPTSASESALEKEDVDVSDWWFNYALGALAGSKTAIAASEVAENVNKGLKFETLVERTERKLFRKYRNQILRQTLEHQYSSAESPSYDRATDDAYYGLSPSPGASPRMRRVGEINGLDETLRELEMPFEASEKASRNLARRSTLDQDSDSEEEGLFLEDSQRFSGNERAHYSGAEESNTLKTKSPERLSLTVPTGMISSLSMAPHDGIELPGATTSVDRSAPTTGRSSKTSGRSLPSSKGSKKTRNVRCANVVFEGKAEFLEVMKPHLSPHLKVKLIGAKIGKSMDTLHCKLYSAETLVHTSKINSPEIPEWHESVLLPTVDSAVVATSIAVCDSKSELGRVTLDDDIISDSCRTQNVTSLKLFKSGSESSIGTVDIAMAFVDTLQNASSTIEFSSKSSSVTMRTESLEIEPSGGKIVWEDGCHLKGMNMAETEMVCRLVICGNENDGTFFESSASMVLSAGNVSVPMVTGGITGERHTAVGQLSVFIDCTTPRESRTSILGSTLPMTGSKPRRGSNGHKRLITFDGNANPDALGASMSRPKVSSRGNPAGLAQIDAFLVRFAKSVKSRGEDLKDTLLKYWIMQDGNANMKKVDVTDSDIELTYESWFLMLFKLVDSIEDSAWLDNLSDSTLSESLATMTMNDGSKTKGKIALSTFLDYILNLYKGTE